MGYATQENLVERFGAEEVEQLTDRALPQQGAIVAAVAARALADADALIDRYLGARYTVPIAAPLPADLTRVACDVARYLLHDQAPPEIVRANYEDAVDWLKDIAAGKLPLIGSAGGIVVARSSSFGPGVVAPYPSGAVYGEGFAAAWAP